MVCRNRTEPENQPVAVNGGLEFAMEVVEKRIPCMTTNAGAWSDEEGRKVSRNQRLVYALGLPMLSSDELVGVLILYTPVPHSFSEHEIGFLTTLTDQAAAAAQNATTISKKLRTENNELRRANVALKNQTAHRRIF